MSHEAVAEIVAHGPNEGDGRLARRAAASTCASSRPSPTATCSSTSRARRSTTSHSERRPCDRGCPSPSTGSSLSRRTRWSQPRTRRRSTGASATSHPARAPREPRRARGGEEGRASRRSSRPATCAATSTCTRRGRPTRTLAGGDGPRGAGARLRVHRRNRPLALPARRRWLRCSGGGDRGTERGARAVPHPPGGRGEHRS